MKRQSSTFSWTVKQRVSNEMCLKTCLKWNIQFCKTLSICWVSLIFLIFKIYNFPVIWGKKLHKFGKLRNDSSRVYNGVLPPSSKLESPTPIITIINPTPIPGLFILPTSKALESPHQCRPKIRKISNKKTQMRWEENSPSYWS